MQVMASDADDPTYGSSARVVYSVLEGEQHFTVDSKTGEQHPAGLGPSLWDIRGPGRGCASCICLVLGSPCHGRCWVLERRMLPGSLQCSQHRGARPAAASPACPACACTGRSSSVRSVPSARVRPQARQISV